MYAVAGVGAGSVGVGSGLPMLPLSYVPASLSPPDVEPADEPDGKTEPAESAGGSLTTVAKAAATKAERAAIEHTLGQVQWNRRKAAQSLGVSYKTLLNKIKECGISRA